jgi:hypothetical protein
MAVMEELTVVGVTIDFCRSGCQGIYFDNFEMQKMDEKHEGEGDAVLEELLSLTRDKDHRSNPLVCPRCDIKMRKTPYSYGTGIDIDRCYGCNGVWLDKGELAAIRENFRDEKVRRQIVDNVVADDPKLASDLSKREQEMQLEQAKYNKRRSGIFGLFKIFER